MILSDLLRSALLNSGAVSLTETIYAEDLDNALTVFNTIINRWQVNRWLVYDLVDVAVTSTAASSYTVGPSGTFVFSDQRPDKIDAAFVRLISTGEDTILYPFMSREGYDRSPFKSKVGDPFSFFYDPALGTTGTVFFAPVPDTIYSIHLNAKASLGAFTTISQSMTLPAPYIAALNWGLAEELRSTYRLPPDPTVSKNAAATLAAITNSVAQVPQVTTPAQGNRAGVFSVTPIGGAPQSG